MDRKNSEKVIAFSLTKKAADGLVFLFAEFLLKKMVVFSLAERGNG
jgi:hypothetical protein